MICGRSTCQASVLGAGICSWRVWRPLSWDRYQIGCFTYIFWFKLHTLLWGRYYQSHFKIKKLVFQKWNQLSPSRRSSDTDFMAGTSRIGARSVGFHSSWSLSLGSSALLRRTCLLTPPLLCQTEVWNSGCRSELPGELLQGIFA